MVQSVTVSRDGDVAIVTIESRAVASCMPARRRAVILPQNISVSSGSQPGAVVLEALRNNGG